MAIRARSRLQTGDRHEPNYPFRFHRGDVKSYALEHSNHDFAWASPVCKRYTRMTNCREGVAVLHPDDHRFHAGDACPDQQYRRQ
jgi:hypothetical protein